MLVPRTNVTTNAKRREATQAFFLNPKKAFEYVDSTPAGMVRRFTYIPSSLAAATGVSVSTSTVTLSAEWAQLSARFSEFRVLGMRVYVRNNGSNGTLIYSVDRSGVLGAPGSATAAWQQAGAKLVQTNNSMSSPARLEALATDLEDYNFQPIASPSNVFAISMYNDSAAAVIYYVEFAAELRGVR